ncbi:MAG TPA: hypothetical protein QF624_03980 [Dehalococcoidia bacterium]|nr:hypothetical protein [Dehalococcoidia bacterium]
MQGEVDSAYLDSLASATDGEFLSVAGEQGLSAVFASLGRRLGADVAVTVQVPPLSVGSHDFLLRFPVLGENIESNLQFPVSNAGLLVARVTDAPPPVGDAPPVEPLDEALIVRIDAATDLYSFQLQAAVGGGEPVLLTDGADRILVDPWAMAPGTVEVRVEALLRFARSDRFAGETVISVDIPALAPVLNLRRTGAGTGRELIASGRVQNTPGVIVRVFVDGDEVSNSDGFQASDAEAEAAAAAAADGTPTADADAEPDDEPVPAAVGAMVSTTTSVPTEAQIEVRLENQQGDLLANQFLDVQLDKLVPISAEEASASAEEDNVQLALIGLGMLLLVGTSLVVLSRRRR